MSMMPTSFSRLTTFEQCGAKFDYLYVSRRIQDEGNEFTIFGNRVHEALEAAGKATGELVDEDYPMEVRAHIELIRRILAQPGEKHFELKVAINDKLESCDWMAEDVWIRGILDVLVVDGKRAVVLDWKTGKVRENMTQLQLFAVLVFLLYPEVEEVRTAFIWLGYGQVTDAVFHRRNLSYLWGALMPRFKRLQDAVDLGVFKARPSMLCKWCPAKFICPEARV